MAKMKYISIPEFAKQIDRTPEYIRRLIAKGKIPKTALRLKGKRWLVDPEKAIAAIQKNVSYINRGKRNKKNPKPKQKPKQNPTRKSKQKPAQKTAGKKKDPSTEEKKAELEAAGIVLNDGASLSDAQRVDAYYKALIRKQIYEKESGNLIEIAKVEKTAYEAGRKIRDQLLSIPDRCAALVAAESDQFECNQILLKEINHILEGLNDALQISK